jgi:[calcium/calmodulin-dependent protein kinase] kinase
MNIGFFRRFLKMGGSEVHDHPPQSSSAATHPPNLTAQTSEDSVDLLEVDERLFSEALDTDDEYSIHGYKFQRKLGSGASGEVVQMSKDGRLFAVKICESSKSQTPSFLKSPEHDPKEEAVLLRNLNHPYIVKMFEFVDDLDKGRFYIVMELLTGGTIEKLTDLTEKRRAFGQLLSAIQYLHLHGLAHRDIKPENVMLDDLNRIRLCDFGISIHVQPNSKIPVEMKGTPAFLAPEMFTSEVYDPFIADLWAIGVTLFMLVFGTVPFPGGTIVALQRSIVNDEPQFPASAPASLVDLIKKLLAKDPARRIGFTELWAHPWMEGVKPSLVQLMLRVKEICQMTSKATPTTAIVQVTRQKRRRSLSHRHRSKK